MLLIVIPVFMQLICNLLVDAPLYSVGISMLITFLISGLWALLYNRVRKECETVRNESVSLSQRLANLHQERIELEESSRVRRLEDELADTIDELHSMTQRFSIADDACVAKTDAINELTRQIQNRDAVIARKNSELESMSLRAQHYQQQARKHLDEQTPLVMQVNAGRKEVVAQIAAIGAERDRWMAEATRVSAERDQFLAEKLAACDELAEARQEAASEIFALEDQISILRSEIAKMRAENQSDGSFDPDYDQMQ